MNIEQVEKTLMENMECAECGRRKAVICITIGKQVTQLCNECRRELMTRLISYNSKHGKKKKEQALPFQALATVEVEIGDNFDRTE